MKISVTMAVCPSFEVMREAGGEVDIPTRPLATGLHLVIMYDDSSLDMPQHMLAVVVGDEAPNQWCVTYRSPVRSPIGGKEIITVEFHQDAISLYLGEDGERVDVVAQRAAGLPIYEVHSMYSPACRCVHWVPEESDRAMNPRISTTLRHTTERCTGHWFRPTLFYLRNVVIVNEFSWAVG